MGFNQKEGKEMRGMHRGSGHSYDSVLRLIAIIKLGWLFV